MDHHKLWDPNEFAVHCFKIIMYSIQVRIGYISIYKDYVSIYIRIIYYISNFGSLSVRMSSEIENAIGDKTCS